MIYKTDYVLSEKLISLLFFEKGKLQNRYQCFFELINAILASFIGNPLSFKERSNNFKIIDIFCKVNKKYS